MIEKLLNNIVVDGYVLLKSVIPKEIIKEAKKSICDALIKLDASSGDTFSDQYAMVAKKTVPYLINQHLMKSMLCYNIPQKILSNNAILNLFINLIGPDLAFQTNSELPVNVKHETNDSLVKKFHQEFWSGAGIRTFSFWAPIFLIEGAGTLEIIKKSHQWGHIPHKNREPVYIPPDAEKAEIKCSEGDVLIFHSLTLHRTVPNKVECPRVAYTTQIKNIFDEDSGYDIFKNWEIFHLSPASKIMKICGNPHLSPFRTYGSSRKQISLSEKAY